MATYELVLLIELEAEVLVEASSEEEAIALAQNLNEQVKYAGAYPCHGADICSCGTANNRASELQSLPHIAKALQIEQ